MRRRIILLCGIGTTGKSHWSKILMAFLANENPVFVDLDEVRIKYWGDRILSDEEHLLKNSLARMEVMQQFVENAGTVIFNATTLTEKYHQIPLIETAQNTERILGVLKNKPITIDVRAIWFDCSDEMSAVRLARRQNSDTSSNVTNNAVLERDKIRFQPPGKYYPYIKIDTSDESAQADIDRFNQIIEFIKR